MIGRTVKMTFVPEKVNDFLKIFELNREKIFNSPGCRMLELIRYDSDGSIFSTYSEWDQPEDLKNYRNSELFKQIWAQVKPLFAADTEAFTMDLETKTPIDI